MARTEGNLPTEQESHFPEASKEILEKRGWVPEALQNAGEQLKALAEAGFARMSVPAASDVTPEGFILDPKGLARLIVALPDRTRKALTAAGTALMVGAGGFGVHRILDAGPGVAAEQQPTIHEVVMKRSEKIYTLPPGTEEFEVRLNGKNVDIKNLKDAESDVGYEKKEKDGRTVFRVKAPGQLNTIRFDVDPKEAGSVDVGIYATTTSERDLQLLEDVSGEMKFLSGASTPEGSSSIASYALVESVLGGRERKSASGREAYILPLNIRLFNSYPQSNTAGVGVSSGYVYVSDMGLIRKAGVEGGIIYDPKAGKMLAEQEGLVALSFQGRLGRGGLNAEVLQTIGSKGKAAGEVTLDYATLPDRGEGSELRIGAGFGVRGADAKASEIRYATVPLTWRTPWGTIKGGPEMNVDTGEVRVAGGMKIDTGRITKAAGEKWKEIEAWMKDMMKKQDETERLRTENRELKEKLKPAKSVDEKKDK